MMTVLLVIIAGAVRVVDWRAVAHSIASASVPLVIATAVITFLSTVIKGIRWWLFLRHVTGLGIGHVVRLTILGTGVNSVLFANAGDMVRVGLVAREARVPVGTVVRALALDKVVEVLAFVTMLVALGTRLPVVFHRNVEIAAIGLVIVALAVLFATRAELRRRETAAGYALSLISWATQVAAYATGAMAVGVAVPIAAIAIAVASVNLGGLVRSTPGNVGVFQLMFALALAPFGVANGQAVAAAVLIQAVQILSASIAGGIAATRFSH